MAFWKDDDTAPVGRGCALGLPVGFVVGYPPPVPPGGRPDGIVTPCFSRHSRKAVGDDAPEPEDPDEAEFVAPAAGAEFVVPAELVPHPVTASTAVSAAPPRMMGSRLPVNRLIKEPS
jgi:hypothetical protein